MFSIVLSALIINNKIHEIEISRDFYNFVIFCLIFDILSLYYEFYNTKNRLDMLINIVAIIETSMVIKTGVGNKLSELSYGLAITLLVLESIKIIKHKYIK